jgi:hypothetical protein
MSHIKAKIFTGLVLGSMLYNIIIKDASGFVLSSAVLPLCLLALSAPDKK